MTDTKSLSERVWDHCRTADDYETFYKDMMALAEETDVSLLANPGFIRKVWNEYHDTKDVGDHVR